MLAFRPWAVIRDCSHPRKRGPARRSHGRSRCSIYVSLNVYVIIRQFKLDVSNTTRRVKRWRLKRNREHGKTAEARNHEN